MYRWSKIHFTFVIATICALSQELASLKIDNQLQVIKSDCYERLAIGQRLNPKNVYKTTEVKTVPECQMVCTKEKESCKSFSFGIGIKGNATCELSADPIKETIDLKPIGTIANTEFDLYIKKLGCSLVLDKNKEASYGPKPPPTSTISYGPPSIKPVSDNYPSASTSRPSADGVEHVQTLVSISTGPQKTILHPIHEILIAEAPYNYAKPQIFTPHDYKVNPNLDNYETGPLPQRYGSYIPRPEDYYFRPRPTDYFGYDRPDRPDDSYNADPGRPIRPSDGPYRPLYHYDHRPNRPYNEGPSRPNRPSGYESWSSKPNDGYRPNRPFDFRPLDHYNQKPRPPSDYENKPNRPNDGYVSPTRPSDYDNRPTRPNNGYNQTPSGTSDYGNGSMRPSDYETRPTRPNDGYYLGPSKPSNHDNKPTRPSDGYNQNPNLPSDHGNRPTRPSDYETKPRPSDYNKRPTTLGDGYNKGTSRPSDYENTPTRPIDSHRPFNYDNRPTRPNDGSFVLIDYKPQPSEIPNRLSVHYNQRPGLFSDSQNRPDNYGGKPVQTSVNDYLFNKDVDRYDPGPSSTPQPTKEESNKNKIQGPETPKKSIITQSVGYHGEAITSIITELDERKSLSCFRRVLAGKRVTRALIKRALYCERIEDCQNECADEKRFVCEGFNYRLDPANSGKGECELLDIPLARLDIGRDLYPDPDYDYYEKDRNAGGANCKRRPPPGYYDRRPIYKDWDNRNSYGNGNRRPPPPRPIYGNYDYDDGYRPGGNRRGDFAYHHSDHSDHYHYQHYDHGPLPPLPPPTPPHDSYEPYLPPPRRPTYDDWGQDKRYGTNYNPHDYDNKNYYLPPKIGTNTNWGQYGGTYGTGGVNLHYNGYGHSQSFDFWGLNKYDEKVHNYGDLPPSKKPINGGGYLPELPLKPPTGGGTYLPVKPNLELLPPSSIGGGSGEYLPQPPPKPPLNSGYLPDIYGNAILPAEPRFPPHRLEDECSLRTATGFKLRKTIVKKFYAVPNIYECELLCFKEKDFPCAAYAYRYTISLTSPTDNCYLSNRSYKELDFYTDLQPDRDFDIYTMNNPKMCEQPIIHHARQDSECFWRVRSGQRLDHKVVRDSLTVKSIVECQIECLKAGRFTCRAFSFRYGSPVIGGVIDNCQLTDWPFYELDPHVHLAPEPGFEVYERGSFGHGCETDHFGIRGKPWKNSGARLDQMCYVGFGSPAKLLHQATRKQIQVTTEEECKAECSKFRAQTIFHCMSFSFSNHPKWEANCKLSDIMQRDLLPNVDYGPDQDSWLFAWDNYNPECRAVENDPMHNHVGHGGDMDRHDYPGTALGTWRIYSVSGWPCRRGSICQENREAGFWFCELEGGTHEAWDYCCRPDHQCGFSEGFPYQWCYVGPARTQWRKCSERYYPYIHHIIDRFDPSPPATNYLPEHRPPPPVRPSWRPDRPPAPSTYPPPRPSLDEYEQQFESHFLDPPKPGGFGQPRHWPISYLHKESPPNTTTDSEPRLMKALKTKENPKFAAIQNLIDIIKSNDLKNVQYQITNESNKMDDILFVKIPLPTNFTQENRKSEKITANLTATSVFEGTEIFVGEAKNSTKRSQKSLNLNTDKPTPVYRRSYVTRTNITAAHRRGRNIRTL